MRVLKDRLGYFAVAVAEMVEEYPKASPCRGHESEEEHVEKPTVPVFKNNRRKVSLTQLRKGRTLKVRFKTAQGTEMGTREGVKEQDLQRRADCQLISIKRIAAT